MLNKKLDFIIIICSVSFFLLVAASPIFSLLWLLVPTAYFLWDRNYKDILRIWGFTFGSWYLIFTTSLSGITILIGFENTKVVVEYLLNNDFMFHTLCFQTVYILDFLSAKVGFPLYIPAVINIFSFLGKDRPQCSNEENSNTPPFWRNKPARKSEGEKTLEKCQALEKEMRKFESIIPNFVKVKSTTDGSKTTTYSEIWVPFIGKIINCTSRKSTELEKEI